MFEDMVTSYTQGRVRLRHNLLKNKMFINEILSILHSISGIKNIEHKTLTGSLLIEYDPEILDEEAVTALLGQAEQYLKENVSIYKDTPVDKESELSEKFYIATQKEKNILTKSQKRKIFYGGMFTAFVGTLLSGSVGDKKTHYVAGSIFAGLTVMHMWRMRKIF